MMNVYYTIIMEPANGFRKEEITSSFGQMARGGGGCGGGRWQGKRSKVCEKLTRSIGGIYVWLIGIKMWSFWVSSSPQEAP